MNSHKKKKNSKTLKLAIRDATNIFDKAFNTGLQIIDKNIDTKIVNEKGMPYRHIHYHTVLGNMPKQSENSKYTF